MADLLIKCENISKEYGKIVKTKALNEVNLQIFEGEFSSIIGQSGCGKSTLLNMLGTLDKPTSGNLFYKDIDISTMNDDELAGFRNESIGFIFQFHYLLPEFTALENVLIPTWINKGFVSSEKEELAVRLLETVGLKERINNPANNLSGGQQQRVSIARALINQPKLVLADEPTGNLDSDSTEQVYDLLRQINRDSGVAFLIVTHDRHIAEKSDRIIEMKDGKIVKDYSTKGKNPEQLWKDIAPANCKLRNLSMEGGTNEDRICMFDNRNS